MYDFQQILAQEETLDPADWTAMRVLGHRMIDDMMDYLQHIGERPIWQPPTEAVKQAFQADLPIAQQSSESIYEEFLTHILPYNKGNIHPRFWGWVQGTGTPLGMLADMLASGMNPNNTIGDHAPMYVESQVLEWCKTMMGFPAEGSGLLVSGASMANVTALIVGRNWFEQIIREKGLYGVPAPLVMYCSVETHNCVFKAAEAIGIGQENVRKISVNEAYQIDLDALKAQIAADRAAGLAPFCLVANAGTVNTGAIDPLAELRAIATHENIWFHIDGAFGALAKLTPEFAETLAPIQTADSLAFDLHKWMYMPYEVACVLIRCQKIHRSAFALTANYLLHHERGLSAGIEARANYGLELSRGFKALKVWMSLKEHGLEKYSRLIRQNIAQAFYLGDLVAQHRDLELLAPVTMNIVCFRYRPVGTDFDTDTLNALNKEILMLLHERGIAAPTYTLLHGQYAIRVANVNHRSRKADFDALVAAVLEIGKEVSVNVASIF
ncbi:MAG: pyridoxal-dependent decarboxylase [Spirosomaceae bacterium]|jgi:aromatic-L-amino-acid/L-tryptophan decarboxylase|nr:pyridoxal-dependent decarboxylase [Spirosomataceae bacterium]